MPRNDENELQAEGIVRNISWLTGASLAAKSAWFIFITLVCMRLLTVEGYGVLTASLAYFTLLAFLSDLGTSDLAIREISRNTKSRSFLFSNLFVSRWGLTVLVTILGTAIGMVLGYGVFTLLGAAMYTLSLRQTELCRALYRGIEVLRYESVSLLLEKTLVITGGSALLWTFKTPEYALLGMGLGMALTLALNTLFVHLRIARINYREVRWNAVRDLFREGYQIGLFGLLSLAFIVSGVILVKVMSGDLDAGIFGAAFRVIESSQLLPQVIIAATLARFSSLFHAKSLPSLRKLLKRTLFFAFAVSFAGSVFISLFAPDLVQLIEPSGAFTESGKLLQVLIWVFPLFTLNGILSFTLVATNDQSILVRINLFFFLVNLGIQVLLISIFGYWGAAFALILSTMGLLLTCGYFVRKRLFTSI